jgi:hypothetical protein
VKLDFSEGDKLWELLGKASTARPSPFFSRNVLRQIRSTNEAPPLLPLRLLRWLGAMAFCVVLLCFSLSLQENSARPPSAQLQAELIEVFDRAAGLPGVASVEEFTLARFAGL